MIDTKTLDAYARSRNLPLEKAAKQLYASFTYGSTTMKLTPSDEKRVTADLAIYAQHKKLQPWMLKELENTRRRQLQLQARRSYGGQPLFV